MPELVPMPKLGFDMAEGTLVRKVKPAGATIKKDEVLAEIETDKATVEVTAPVDGVVATWLVEEGQPIPVGTLMAVIAAPGETVDLETLRAPAQAPTGQAADQAQPAAQPPADTAAIPSAQIVHPTASPLARKMAAEAGADLHQLRGTGPGGRIVKKDVEAYLHAAGAPAAPALPLTDEAVPLTKLRQIIARRMTESKQTIPQFYVTINIDMAAALDLRAQVNAVLPAEHQVSVNDLVVKAAALALREFPNLNASFAGDKVIRKAHINAGLAVAVTGGLLTVVIKAADQKPLAQLAAEAKALIGRARAGKVQEADIAGSTFSISNLGMYQAEHFLAIINPPEAMVLAVGAVQNVPVVTPAGGLAPGRRMQTTISADHRVTDGAEAAQYLQALKKNLEEPLRLMV